MHLIAALYLICVARLVDALYVTAGSPCASTCRYGNNTFWPDLVCADSDFDNTSKGQLLKECLKCQGQSLYVNGTKSDEYSYIFHFKYFQQSCLIDTNIPHSAAIKACATECAPLRTVLSILWVSKEPWLPQYSYCTNDSSAYPTYAPKCGKCLQAQEGAVVLGNMVDTMVNACVDKPLAADGNLVKSSRDVFNTTVVPLSSTTSPTNSSSTSSPATQSSTLALTENQGLGAAAAAGIGVGIAIVLIAAVMGALFFMKKRKRTRLLKHSEEPAPVYYASGTDTKDAKHERSYHSLHLEPLRQELHGHETVEADSRPIQKGLLAAELPAAPYK